MIHHRFAFLFAAAALAVSACGGATSDEASSETTDQALSTFGKTLVGSWHRVDAGPILSALTLRADGSYGSDEQVECFRAPCNPIHTEGRWSASGHGTTGALRLTPARQRSATYDLALSRVSTRLELDPRDGSAAILLDKDPQTCGGIAALPCPSGLECVYASGITYPDQAGQCLPCGAAGTSCGGVAGLPCFDGLTCVVTATHPDAMGVCTAE